MRIRWFGQSTFQISGERTVFIDPFGALEGLAERGLRFDYPPVEGVEADLLLVTHEHVDHNAVEVIGGSPRSYAPFGPGWSSPCTTGARPSTSSTRRTSFSLRLVPASNASIRASLRPQFLGTADDPTVALLTPPASFQ